MAGDHFIITSIGKERRCQKESNNLEDELHDLIVHGIRALMLGIAGLMLGIIGLAGVVVDATRYWGGVLPLWVLGMTMILWGLYGFHTTLEDHRKKKGV